MYSLKRIGKLSIVFLGILMAVLLLSSKSQAANPSPNLTDKEIVGYFTSWGIYGRDYTVKHVEESGAAEKLTVINYAFANLQPVEANGQVVCQIGDAWADYQKTWTAVQSVDGIPVYWGEPLRGNFQQLKALKAMHPDLKVLISLGGWTWSTWFSDAALTAESRTAFVASCIDLFIHGNLPEAADAGGPGSAAGVFDGIDIDWEYPNAPGAPGHIYRPEDTENFTALLAEFRAQLDDIDPGLLLTIAAPAGESQRSQIEMNRIHPHLDWINVMTYDFNGTWNLTAYHQANLFDAKHDPTAPETRISVHRAIQAYLQGGIPAHKLIVGVPFYGHGWTGVTNEGNGLFQPATGPAEGTWGAGSNDYKVLSQLIDNGYTRYWDRAAMIPWLFNGETFWTFEDPESICYKSVYINANQLGGVMFWELSGDDQTGTLITAIDNGLAGATRPSDCR